MAKESNTCTFSKEIAHHSQGKGNTKPVKGDRGVFSPCTNCTHDQWKNLIFCLMMGQPRPQGLSSSPKTLLWEDERPWGRGWWWGTSCSVSSWNPHPHPHVQMLLRALCVRSGGSWSGMIAVCKLDVESQQHGGLLTRILNNSLDVTACQIKGHK